jgi:ribosome-associated protein
MESPDTASGKNSTTAMAGRGPPYNHGMLEITQTLTIPDEELIERFVRSSGPGGQNVNKVATAVELRFDIASSPSLPEPVRERLLAKRDRRVTDAGVLVLNAQRFRTQERNRDDARERLAAFIASGLRAPVPRIATKPTRAAKQRRLNDKRERSTIKRERTRQNWD